jgi:Flp pilus assembly protein TadD
VLRRELDGGLAYVDQLRRERPDDVDVLVLRGVVLREKGMLDEAEDDLKLALKIDPRRGDAHAALGILYDLRRDGERAHKHHREATALKPEDPALLNNLGFSLFLHGRVKDAVPVLQQAVKLQPTNRRIRTNLGFAHAALNDFPRAAREFDLGGTPAEAKNNLGYAYERQGRLVQAYELYVESVRLDPRSERARENLQHVAKSLGKEIPADLPPVPAVVVPAAAHVTPTENQGAPAVPAPAPAPRKEAMP